MKEGEKEKERDRNKEREREGGQTYRQTVGQREKDG